MYDRLAGSVPQALWVEGDYVLPWELGSRERSVLQGALIICYLLYTVIATP